MTRDVRAVALLMLIAPAEAAMAGEVPPPLHFVGAPKITFFASGSPGALDIEGRAAVANLVDDGTTLTVQVPLAGVNTGIELRDEHMRDHYLEVKQWPEASLALAKADVVWPSMIGDESKGKTSAAFTVHGQTHDVQVDWDIKRTKAGFAVSADFPYDVTSWGIEIPVYLGITIAPNQRVETRFTVAAAESSHGPA